MNSSRLNLPLKKYIIAFFFAFLVTVVLQSLLSVVFSFFPPGEKVFDILCSSLGYFSSTLAAFFCARVSGKKGFLTGIISADMYIAILLSLGIVLLKNTYEMSDIIRIFAISSSLGIVGGIMGINFK